MSKQLLSIHGLIEEDLNNKLKTIIIQSNDLDLSNHFLNYYLHASLKRSFYLNDENVIEFLKLYFKNIKPINCQLNGLMIQKDMLWLNVISDELIDIHNELDNILLNKFNIRIDEYDKNYFPHITLFSNSPLVKLEKIKDKLNNFIFEDNFIIDKINIGKDINNMERINL